MTRDKYGIPLYANSTLLSMPKSELLGYIRTIEHNWRSAEQTLEIQAENCKRLLAEERNKAIDDCIDKFANILSNIPNICGRQCPVKCNWGTEENCKEMCKKWLKEQLKDGGKNERS